MRTAGRLLILLEALVCFGPLLFVLCLGLLVAPVWLIGLALEPETTNEPAWSFLYPLLMVGFGLGGAVAVILVGVRIVRGRRSAGRATLVLAACGIVALLMFNWPWISTILAGEATVDAVWPLLFYFVLPLGGAIHLLYLLSPKATATKTRLDAP